MKILEFDAGYYKCMREENTVITKHGFFPDTTETRETRSMIRLCAKISDPRKSSAREVVIKIKTEANVAYWGCYLLALSRVKSSYKKPLTLFGKYLEACRDRGWYGQEMQNYYYEMTEPQWIRMKDRREYWLFMGKVYAILNKKEDYDNEKTALLLLEHINKERKKFEKLKKKHLEVVDTKEEDYRRIPEDVRIFVWRRDGGKCVKCHSREKLEYDHIVPLSKGGSNTARNVELLCEKCNREKSGNIG